ncbi:MAG: LysM peptidoglycan-binding domain-containing protein [Verrucomicrobiales bacterium]
MNKPNPLIPQGTLNPARGASNLRIAVITIAAIHVVFFGGLLLQGCKRDPKLEATNTATNAEPSTAAPSTTSSYGPIDPTNSMYYTSPSTLPTDAGTGSNAATPTTSAGTRSTDLSSTPATTDYGLTTPASPTTTAGATGGETREYTVVRNDSFYKIAKQNGITVAALTRANPNVDASRLKVGTKLSIPAPEPAAAKTVANGGSTNGTGNHYVVKSGDTLTRVASQHGVTVSELRSANGLKTSRLNVGQKLKIPAKAAATPAAQ